MGGKNLTWVFVEVFVNSVWIRSIYALLILIFLATIVFTAHAEAPPITGGVIRDINCPPRLLLRHPYRCTTTGTGTTLVQLALKGLYPKRSLPLADINVLFSYVPFGYLRSSNGSVRLYPTVEDARNKTNPGDRIKSGFVYLSYFDTDEGEGNKIYKTQRGFVKGEKVSRVTPSSFVGLAFSRTPDRPFGWINSGGSCPQRTPGGVEDYADHCFMRYEVVQVYDTRSVDDEEWYLIGINEWLQARYISKVSPDTSRPEGVEGDRWITVDLAEQTVAAYEKGELVYATATSTGRYGTWTQPGTFQVWAKLERDNMTGGVEEGFYYLEDVPWVLYFDEARALHGTYWHNQFGAPNSRGCVNLSISDARWFFEFAQEGTWVHVWDPSGETPTDPSLYGAGGA
jgi:hypothetical protein